MASCYKYDHVESFNEWRELDEDRPGLIEIANTRIVKTPELSGRLLTLFGQQKFLVFPAGVTPRYFAPSLDQAQHSVASNLRVSVEDKAIYSQVQQEAFDL